MVRRGCENCRTYFLHERWLACFRLDGDPHTINKCVSVGSGLIQKQGVDRKLLLELGNCFRMLAEGLHHKGHVTWQRLTVDEPPDRLLAAGCGDV